MLLPRPRGRLTSALVEALRSDDASALAAAPATAPADPVADDDLQLALWVCFELHYRGFDDVSDSWEWQPKLIALRAELESMMLSALRRDLTVEVRGNTMAERLQAVVEAYDGPQLSRFMQTQASREQFAEFVIHRSIYQLKEADPHSWAIPRLAGKVKAALVEIQADEYGGGDPNRMHSELFRNLLRGFGLDDEYGGYLDEAPGITLAISNIMSVFGLRRDLRGALVGHLAAYEMTSSGPCRRYAKGLRRLGATEATCQFYDAHVVADALHEQLAAHDLCGALAESEPGLAGDVLFGAAACLHIDNRFAEHVLGCWADDRPSLLPRSASHDLESAAGTALSQAL